ncbi:MAG: DUF29 family protein, partial [Pseudanabaena sp.]
MVLSISYVAILYELTLATVDQNLDVENLIEELEGLAGRDRREVSNR